MVDLKVSPDELRDLARRRKRRVKRRKTIRFIAERIALICAFATADGWFLMIAVDVVHNHWIHALPTIGYGWAVSLIVLLRGVFSPLPSLSKKGITR